MLAAGSQADSARKHLKLSLVVSLRRAAERRRHWRAGRNARCDLSDARSRPGSHAVRPPTKDPKSERVARFRRNGRDPKESRGPWAFPHPRALRPGVWFGDPEQQCSALWGEAAVFDRFKRHEAVAGGAGRAAIERQSAVAARPPALPNVHCGGVRCSTFSPTNTLPCAEFVLAGTASSATCGSTGER